MGNAITAGTGTEVRQSTPDSIPDASERRNAPELLNRMSSKTMGRVVKASMLSLALALGVGACSNDYTVSYVYMTTSKALPHGLINAYQVDYQSGYLRPLADSPVDAGGRDTVGMVVRQTIFLCIP